MDTDTLSLKLRRLKELQDLRLPDTKTPWPLSSRSSFVARKRRLFSIAVMTAKEALDAATVIEPGERLAATSRRALDPLQRTPVVAIAPGVGKCLKTSDTSLNTRLSRFAGLDV